MISKQKLYSIALVSAAMGLMLISIAGAAPYAYITNSVSNNVSVIDTATNQVTATVNVGSYPYGVAISPDGTKVYVANSDNPGIVSVISTITNQVVATVPVGQYPYGVAVTPRGTKVYVTEGYDPGQVSVIDTVTNQVAATVNVGKAPTGIAVTPDGTKVYVANGGNSNVSVINTATDQVIATVSVGNAPQGVAISPDGTKVYVANNKDGTVSVIDTTTNTVTTVNVGKYPNGVAVTPDGTKVYVANSNYGGSGTVSVINTGTNQVTATVPVGYGPYGVAVTPDGTKIYVANADSNNVSVIDVASNTVTTSVNVGTNPYVIGQFIGKAIPTLTWNPNPTTITYGTPLVAGQLNAQSSASGTFAYKDGSTPVNIGTILSAGTHTLTATFTSTDPNYASGGTVTATITVNKVNPTITWNNPADIPYGIPLSSTQLDATSSVPGNFVYTPPAGTILSAGLHQTLSVTFTPTDIADYNIATATVSINVMNAGLKITKKASPLTYDDVGQIITYTYTVKNVGDVDIKGPITVTDDKFGTIIIPNSDTLSPGSSVTGPAVTYQITDKDIDRRSVTNLAYATGSFNGYTITSPKTVAVVLYKHREHPEEHPNDEGNFGPNYIGAGVPGPMMNGPMYGGPMPMYGNEQPYGYDSEPTESPNSDSNGHKAKAHLSKHKHKNHSKHHKEKKLLSVK